MITASSETDRNTVEAIRNQARLIEWRRKMTAFIRAHLPPDQTPVLTAQLTANRWALRYWQARREGDRIAAVNHAAAYNQWAEKYNRIRLSSMTAMGKIHIGPLL